MAKSEVYSWRLSRQTKTALEDAARRERTTVSALLERIAHEWLRRIPVATAEEARQRRLHAAARRCFGTIHGGDQARSETVRQAVGARILRRHGR
jgi:hypothetical protein